MATNLDGILRSGGARWQRLVRNLELCVVLHSRGYEDERIFQQSSDIEVLRRQSSKCGSGSRGPFAFVVVVDDTASLAISLGLEPVRLQHLLQMFCAFRWAGHSHSRDRGHPEARRQQPSRCLYSARVRRCASPCARRQDSIRQNFKARTARLDGGYVMMQVLDHHNTRRLAYNNRTQTVLHCASCTTQALPNRCPICHHHRRRGRLLAGLRAWLCGQGTRQPHQIHAYCCLPLPP